MANERGGDIILNLIIEDRNERERGVNGENRRSRPWNAEQEKVFALFVGSLEKKLQRVQVRNSKRGGGSRGSSKCFYGEHRSGEYVAGLQIGK